MQNISRLEDFFTLFSTQQLLILRGDRGPISGSYLCPLTKGGHELKCHPD